MTALPPIADLTGASITEAQAKTWFSNLRGYLSGMFGDDGNITTAMDRLAAIFAAGVSAKSSAYTVAASDRGVLLNCTGTWTLSLLAAATAGVGFAVAVKNSGTGVITIDGNASETIDGELTTDIRKSESCFLVCNGSKWWTVGRNMPAYPISVSQGGTAATTASSARDNLSVVSRDHGQGNVGSLCFARSTSPISAGSTISGSSLKASGIAYSRDCQSGAPSLGVTLSGTWRALGTLTHPGGSDFEGLTLFQRIS